uniref:Uncharacterized protein n=1 Tax=Anopheles melas TaxID=34690 RepID=A0A182TLN5_9DIPT
MVQHMEQSVGDVGRSISIFPFISKCTLEMVCGTTIGCDVMEQPGKETFIENVDRCFELVAKRMLNIHHYIELLYRFSRDCIEESELRTSCYRFFETVRPLDGCSEIDAHRNNHNGLCALLNRLLKRQRLA